MISRVGASCKLVLESFSCFCNLFNLWSWYVLRKVDIFPVVNAQGFMQCFWNCDGGTSCISIIQVLFRNANSLALNRSTESAVYFNKFPGDSDACSSWKAAGLHAFMGSQQLEHGVSRRTLGEVVKSRVWFVTSQLVNEWIGGWVLWLNLAINATTTFLILKMWAISLPFLV